MVDFQNKANEVFLTDTGDIRQTLLDTQKQN